MLNDVQKKVIEAEERFRHEIKNKIMAEAAGIESKVQAAAKVIQQGEQRVIVRLFAFLNTSLGTWFLTSVFVTGGAGLYQHLEHHYETQRANHQEIVKYRYEIENRIDHLELGLRRAKTVGETKEVLQRLYRGKFPLSLELQNRALGSMYLNLYELLKGQERTNSQEAIAIVRQLQEAEVALDSQPDSQLISDADKAKLQQLVQQIKSLHFKQI